MHKTLSNQTLCIKCTQRFLCQPLLLQVLGRPVRARCHNDFGVLKNASGTTYTYTAKDQLVSTFNSSGQLVTVADPNGLTTTFSYSSSKLSTITEPDGGVGTFSHNGSGLLSTIQRPARSRGPSRVPATPVRLSSPSPAPPVSAMANP